MILNFFVISQFCGVGARGCAYGGYHSGGSSSSHGGDGGGGGAGTFTRGCVGAEVVVVFGLNDGQLYVP